jgi:hypothetical protein
MAQDDETYNNNMNALPSWFHFVQWWWLLVVVVVEMAYLCGVFLANRAKPEHLQLFPTLKTIFWHLRSFLAFMLFFALNNYY